MSWNVRRVRQVLGMDANEAMDGLAARYLRLFKRHPLLMHVLALSFMVAVFAYLWLEAGRAWALAMLALWLVWTVAFGVLGWVKHRRSTR